GYPIAVVKLPRTKIRKDYLVARPFEFPDACPAHGKRDHRHVIVDRVETDYAPPLEDVGDLRTLFPINSFIHTCRDPSNPTSLDAHERDRPVVHITLGVKHADGPFVSVVGCRHYNSPY